MSEGYNGWSNYPTWNVNLWLSNDEGLYNQTTERVRSAIWERYSINVDPRGPVAEALKTWVTEELAPDLGASFAADLLGWALDQVDWREIAAAWIEDVGEQQT